MRDLIVRVARGIIKDNCMGYAAQMAFFFLFALFPFILFLTTLLAYLPVPDLLGLLLNLLSNFAPDDVLLLLKKEFGTLVSERQGGLLSFGVLLSLWTSSTAITTATKALNDALQTGEQRPYWKVRGIAILLVVGSSFFIILSLLMLIFGRHTGDWVASLAGFGSTFTLAWNIVRWPLIFCFMVIALSGLYRFAPAVRLSWREVVPGAITATAAWIAVSLAFSFYMRNFGSYNKTYGSIGTVIALLVWMYASGFAVLLGGEVNSRMREVSREKTVTQGSTGGEKSALR